MNYIAAAQARWPGRTIFGDGRFAVTPKDGGVVYLALTTQQARNISLGIEHPVKADLDLDRVLEGIPDRYDPEERRRARREAKAC